jgi:hypothetical protein
MIANLCASLPTLNTRSNEHTRLRHYIIVFIGRPVLEVAALTEECMRMEPFPRE